MPACGLSLRTKADALRISPASSPASPTRRLPTHQHPDSGERPTAEQIRADLKAIAPYTRAIRTYSSTGGVELVPPIAAEFGLKVTVGAWIDKNEERNEREIRSALDLARRYSNVNAHRGRQRDDAARRDDASTSSSSSSSGQAAEPGAGHHRRNLDGLARPSGACLGGRLHRRAHPALLGRLRRRRNAVDHTIDVYDKLRRMHPGKRIVIAEFGWPSAGYNCHDADPGPHRAGRRAARLRRARRGLRHRLQHHRSHRSAVEDHRRRRRSLLGPVRRLARSRNSPGPARSPIPTTGSSPASPCCSGLLLSLPILAISGATLRAGAAARRRRQRRRRLVRRHRSPSGTAITSCRAPPSRSVSASCC